MKKKQDVPMPEYPIHPDLPICDTHHHFCDLPNDMHLPFSYTENDLVADIKEGHNIVKTVFMNCNFRYKTSGPEELRSLGETESAQKIAEKHACGNKGNIEIAAGIVGFADLSLGDAVSPVIEAHMAASPNRFRGIRHMTAWDDSPDVVVKFPPKGLLMSPLFRKGLARLEKYNLHFEAWVYHPQIAEVVDLAKNFPDISIILNHIGSPIMVGSYAQKKDKVLQDWKTGIDALSKYANVSVKIGGFRNLVLNANLNEQLNSIVLAEIMNPYILWCVERFGVKRCMFESNFPVDRPYFSYTTLWNAYKRVTDAFSLQEKYALFHDTAVKIYRLD